MQLKTFIVLIRCSRSFFFPCFSVSHQSFSQYKGWRSKVTFEKCISYPALSICSFALKTATHSSVCILLWQGADGEGTSYTHLFSAHWQGCLWLPTSLCAFGWLEVTPGLLCDTLNDYPAPKGPNKRENQQQISHMNSCDELLDI